MQPGGKTFFNEYYLIKRLKNFENLPQIEIQFQIGGGFRFYRNLMLCKIKSRKKSFNYFRFPKLGRLPDNNNYKLYIVCLFACKSVKRDIY